MAKETFERLKPYLNAVPPPTADITGVIITVVANAIATAVASFTGGDQAGYIFVVSLTPPVSAGRLTASPSEYKRLCTADNSGLSGSIDFKAAALARFTSSEVGAKMFVGIDIIDSTSGQRWEMVRRSVILT